jgi:hypothetical protein
MTRHAACLSAALLLGLVIVASAAPRRPAPARDAGVPADQTAFFEAKVRPLLLAKCTSCHGETQQRGGLRLDSRQGLERGGANGAIMVAGEPDHSRLVAAVRYEGALRMPPTGKLRPEEIAALEAWVKQGAPWPAAAATASSGKGQAPEMVLTPAQRSFWSFRPVVKPAPPKVKMAAWCRSPIDRFILAGLEAKGLKPAPLADRRTLIRRVTFDLIGLPPTPEEVEAFVADTSPNAWDRVVDRLLASPHYGERWGRHWLDLVRYADSNGLDENVAFANAYKYRDYVVRALNQDKPYDEFICEQLAGDLMPSPIEETNNDRLTATGFLTLGPKLLAEPDKPKMVMDIVDEQIEVTSKAFLGLTVTCARCHNHKFDPIPTKDYYALAGIFKSTKTMASLNTVAMWQERPLQSSRVDPERAAYQAQVQAAQAALDQARARAGAAAGTEEAKRAVAKAEKALADLKQNEVRPPTVMAVEEDKAENCRVHIRGDTQNLGDEVPRHFLTVLGGDKIVIDGERRSGRLELARWIARPDHPLTARVEVNRIWQGHFGAGLVQTPDNWGLLGLRPTNPQLLDWLAATFVENGWSTKKMHRLILTSSTYKMASQPDPAVEAIAARVDPVNALVWKMPRRRLEAEPFRDSMLFVSGSLDLSIGGSLLATKNHDYVTNDQSGNAANYNAPRRSLYLPIIRNALFDMFQAFDYGDPSMVNANRSTTTVAPQALYVMNSPFVIGQARSFARDLLARPRITDGERLRLGYMRAYGRPPAAGEVRRALAYIAAFAARLPASQADSAVRAETAWTSFCQLLFESNEFIYVN